MPKITFIGAGSTVFAKNLLGDILSLPRAGRVATISLHDIDAERLRTTERRGPAHGPGRWARTRPSRRPATAAQRWTAPTTPSPCSRSAATSPAP